MPDSQVAPDVDRREPVQEASITIRHKGSPTPKTPCADTRVLDYDGYVYGKKLQSVLQEIAPFAFFPYPVLIEGESGTGKEGLARALHRSGPRRSKPFTAQDGGGLSETLLESQLFGHKRGAFTGAISDKKGLLEEANGGTFFLDEVAEIPMSIQSKLLRVLQDGEFRRVGDTETRKVDVRVISATNKSLAAEVERDSFRKDLFYRLRVGYAHLPSLRDQSEAIWPTFERVVSEEAARLKTVIRVSSDARPHLVQYDYPGNFRELHNIAQAAVAKVALGTRLITVATIQEVLRFGQNPRVEEQAFPTMERVVASHIEKALAVAQGNVAEAARILNMPNQSLRDKIREFGIDVVQFKPPGKSNRGKNHGTRD